MCFFFFFFWLKKPSSKTMQKWTVLIIKVFLSVDAHIYGVLQRDVTKPKVIWRPRPERRKRLRACGGLTEDISVEVLNSFWQRDNQQHDFSLTLDRFLNVLGAFLSLHKRFLVSVFVALFELYNSKIWRRLISLFGYKGVSMCCVWSRSCAVTVSKDFIKGPSWVNTVILKWIGKCLKNVWLFSFQSGSTGLLSSAKSGLVRLLVPLVVRPDLQSKLKDE